MSQRVASTSGQGDSLHARNGGLMSLTSEVAGATTRSAVSGARREKGATQDAALESQLKDDSNGSRYGS